MYLLLPAPQEAPWFPTKNATNAKAAPAGWFAVLHHSLLDRPAGFDAKTCTVPAQSVPP